MININNTKTIPQSIDRLNDAVLGVDPETKVLSRLYESDEPLQDRVNALEDGQTDLQDRVSALEDGQTNLEETTVQLEQRIAAIDRFTLTNLVENGDLLVDSNSDNIPDGFALQGDSTINSLVNGIWSYGTTGGYRGIKYPYNFIAGNQYYIFGKGKTTLSNTNFYVEYDNRVEVPVSDTMQFFSKTFTVGESRTNLYVLDNRADSSPTNTTYIDYLGAINLTAAFGAGNEPTKEIMDVIITKFGYKQTYELSLGDLFGILSRIQ